MTNEISWDPTQYLTYADLRLRPALELLARVPLERPKNIYDLGCGPGNVTQHLANRWPEAQITGIDSSPAMLEKARAALPQLTFADADLNHWTAPAAADLIYTNAALHWLPDHERLYPRLFDMLAPGGVLAVQIPRNQGAASHQAIRETIEQGAWSRDLLPLLTEWTVLAPDSYYDLLTERARQLDIWETTYLQILSGKDPVKEWTKGTALRPFLDALAGEERTRFEADYAARVAAAYPPRADGKTLFPFRRLFLVATAP